jgi:hypothetical protein
MDYWKEVMDLKKAGVKESKGVANTLTRDDLNTILATADFFGCSEAEMSQIYFDLHIAKYRVFDWLAMAIGGRIPNQSVVKVFTYSFVKSGGVPSKFIEDLQTTDYDVIRDWERIDLLNNN